MKHPYTMTTPCSECPFLKKHKAGFTLARLKAFAAHGEFPCHKSAATNEDENDEEHYGDYQATERSVICAGMLIFNEKRGTPNQMMRICERIGMYDRTKLDMKAPVR